MADGKILIRRFLARILTIIIMAQAAILILPNQMVGFTQVSKLRSIRRILRISYGYHILLHAKVRLSIWPGEIKEWVHSIGIKRALEM